MEAISMSKCDFCNKKNLIKRIFYEKYNWIGFHAAPYHVPGHTIVLPLKIYDKCPENLKDLTTEQLIKMGIALNKISKAIKIIYKPKDILFASVRGHIKHFHFHLIPLYEEDEKKWKKKKRYKDDGHLLEILGDLEKEGDARALKERIQKGWDGNRQRKESEKKLEGKIKLLGKVTGYIVI